MGAAYERLVRADPDRWQRIDARQPADDVHAQVLASVRAARE